MYAPARWAYEPVPHGSVRQLALVRLHVSQQLLHVVYGNRRVHHQRDGCGRNLGHQREILLRFVGQFGVEELVDQHRGAERQQQGVAVGRGLGDGIGAQDAGGTTLVIHHHGLTDALGQGLAHGAGDDVRSAASVERHNQPYRLGRPGHLAGLRHRRAQQTAATEGRQALQDIATVHSREIHAGFFQSKKTARLALQALAAMVSASIRQGQRQHAFVPQRLKLRV